VNINLGLGQYAKFFTAAAGLALTVLTQKYGSATWLPYVVAAASALGVYGVANTPKVLQVKGPNEQTTPLSPMTFSGQLTDAQVAEFRKKFEELYPVKTLPANTPASQAGEPPAATEGLPKGT
jgi:hypothetical protein